MKQLRLPSGVVTCIILVLNHTLRRQRRLKGAYVPYQVRLRTFQFSVRLGALEETGKLQFRRHIEKRSHIQARMPPTYVTGSLQRTLCHHPWRSFRGFIRQAPEIG